MRLGLVSSPLFLQHYSHTAHPENPQRLQAILAALQQQAGWSQWLHLPCRQANPDELALVHSLDYLQQLQQLTAVMPSQALPGQAVPGQTMSGLLDADTYYNADSWLVASTATGSLLNAVAAVLEGSVDSALALLRPPGHHAEADRAMGFCLLNHVAVAAAWAQHRFGIKRVAILDWDVHHGNGTQNAFYANPDLLYISTHQYPLYPGSGSPLELGVDQGYGATLNLPLPANLAAHDYMSLFKSVVVPALTDFSPELLLISAGFDAHHADPLSQQNLSESNFATMALELENMRYDNNKLNTIYVLEGGYHTASLAASVAAVTEVLMDFQLGEERPLSCRRDAASITPFVRHLLRVYPPDIISKWHWDWFLHESKAP